HPASHDRVHPGVRRRHRDDDDLQVHAEPAADRPGERPVRHRVPRGRRHRRRLRAARPPAGGGLMAVLTREQTTPGTAGPLPTDGLRRRRRYTADQVPLGSLLLRLLGGLVVLVVFLLPYLIMFFGSVKTKAEIRSVDPTYFPREWHWDNYLTMWSTPETPLLQNLISTLVISLCATLVVLAVALPAAYYTARFRFRGRLVFLFLVIVTQMVQPAVLTSGLFREFIAMGILDTWLAMILVNAAFNLSFAVWIMHSFFAGIPREVDEAAQLDGAGTF